MEDQREYNTQENRTYRRSSKSLKDLHSRNPILSFTDLQRLVMSSTKHIHSLFSTPGS